MSEPYVTQEELRKQIDTLKYMIQMIPRSQPPGNYAVLGSNNTFTGNNSFNGTTTFNGPVNLPQLQLINGSAVTQLATVPVEQNVPLSLSSLYGIQLQNNVFTIDADGIYKIEMTSNLTDITNLPIGEDLRFAVAVNGQVEHVLYIGCGLIGSYSTFFNYGLGNGDTVTFVALSTTLTDVNLYVCNLSVSITRLQNLLN